MIWLAQEHFGTTRVEFHELPRVEREQIILPDGVLDRVESHTIGFARHVERSAPPGVTCGVACSYTARPTPARR